MASRDTISHESADWNDRSFRWMTFFEIQFGEARVHPTTVPRIRELLHGRTPLMRETSTGVGIGCPLESESRNEAEMESRVLIEYVLGVLAVPPTALVHRELYDVVEGQRLADALEPSAPVIRFASRASR
ncbi:MAG: hypothetical protein JWL72_1194 [Ilumatobacteraceae bacterium]|nr:hypothetical protein [Ilumatobacteraceae bacterium]